MTVLLHLIPLDCLPILSKRGLILQRLSTAYRKKLAAKEEKKIVAPQQMEEPGKDANAFKDEEGNGGANNTKKDKTEESLQPSKVAGVSD